MIRRCILLLAAWTATPVAGRAADMTVLLEAGVPTVDRTWAGPDYATIVKVLSGEKVPLPTLTDEAGRAFFERLTSSANLELIRNRTIAIGLRLQDGSGILVGTAQLMGLYATKGQQRHEELARLCAFALQSAAALTSLVDEYLPVIPRDEQYEARMAGLQQVRSGVSGMFAGAALMLEDAKAFSAADRSRMLAAMDDTLPRVKHLLSRDSRTELRVKLEQLRPTFDGDDLGRIESILAALRGESSTG